jgi:hypothetical protein
MRSNLLAAAATGLSLGVAAPAVAQTPGDPAPIIAAQTEAMRPLAILDGTWRGPAVTTDPTGKKHELTQTERVGSLLGGSVKVVEGRGYSADGTTAFNAFAVISYDPIRKAYTMKSYAQGRAGEFPLIPRPDGFSWEIPAGPAAKIRYNAVVKDGTWIETGEYVPDGKPGLRFFEMTLKRVGDTDWPAGGAVPAK